jgi:hypothetical protein
MTAIHPITRRHALGLSLGALGGLALPPAVYAAKRRPVVVELFTSQGCSSCPPADAFMEELTQDPSVIALSYNVDYWDYLGWKDTLANPDFSQRQYDYAKARGDMDVYTPQMIIDGQSHHVGSHKDPVRQAVAKAQQALPDGGIALDVKVAGSEIEIGIGGLAGAPEGTLWLACVAPNVKVKIERGENAGSDIVYHNVVRRITAAGMWKGEAMTIRLPKASAMAKGVKSLVALLQDGSNGQIRGVARLDVAGA